MSDNIFEQATRQQLRFPSTKGEVTVEQLWQMPLSSRNGFDLDAVAKAVNTELKAAGEESFVEAKSNPAKAQLTLKLDVVKHVISVKLAEKEKAEKSAETAAQRQRLLKALEDSEDAELAKLTPDQIRERLAALSN